MNTIATQQQQVSLPQATFQSASLYVGDLHNEVTEGTLFDMFSRVGPVASIRVCRDAVTRRSLGYAYVNFHNMQDAERSLDTMNFTDIKGRPCRIMWSQRDPSLRKSGVGNVFVKNLAAAVDNKGLFDTFSVFGNILSCKVATDENGVSKGYGYVHYETAEAAQEAISKFNGNYIEDLQVSVGPFVRRQERPVAVNWTNLYVKMFPITWDENRLKDLFAVHGTVANVFLNRDAEGKSKGFGFVNFTEHEAADAALKALSGKVLPDTEAGPEVTFELYVSRAQKRAERGREIKSKMEAAKEDRVSRFQGMNLYVKNIDDSVTDEQFRETFAKYGAITSARIMRDPTDQSSKGFGFVCYSSAEEANVAAVELNNKLLRAKPLTVTLHQRKDVRRAQLAATYAPRGPAGAQRYQGAPIPVAPYMPLYGNQAQFPGQQRSQQPYYQGQPPSGQQQFARGAGQPRAAAGVPFRPTPQQQQAYYAPPQQQPYSPTDQNAYGKRLVPGQQQQQQPLGANGQAAAAAMQRPRQIPLPAAVAPRPGVQVARYPPQQQPIMMVGNPAQQQRVAAGGRGAAPAGTRAGVMAELDDQALAQADPQMQKNMLGERLYPMIYVSQPGLAGKITGMLLEMDNAELLNLIESPEALHGKIEEALAVLRSHQAASAAVAAGSEQ